MCPQQQGDAMPLELSTERTPQTTPAPRPTAAPFFLALGITMTFWGTVTSPVMSIGGLVLLVGSLWVWISAIAKDWSH
jgi:hypothetical protein